MPKFSGEVDVGCVLSVDLLLARKAADFGHICSPVQVAASPEWQENPPAVEQSRFSYRRPHSEIATGCNPFASPNIAAIDPNSSSKK